MIYTYFDDTPYIIVINDIIITKATHHGPASLLRDNLTAVCWIVNVGPMAALVNPFPVPVRKPSS